MLTLTLAQLRAVEHVTRWAFGNRIVIEEIGGGWVRVRVYGHDDDVLRSVYVDARGRRQDMKVAA